jgi:hypothetical protein
MRLIVLLLALVLAGCDYRPPLDRGQVSSIATNVCLAEHQAWGDPTDVLPPGPADANGKTWWQVRYRGVTSAGRARVVIVDAESGWGRLAPPDYVIREPAMAPPPAAAQGAPSALPDGTWILVVVPAQPTSAERDGELTREAMRLNRLAAETNLMPAFSMWSDRAGRTALVWGWQGDRGTVRDPAVVEWLKARSGHREPGWIDLLAR